jgi:PAS domain S-box-containing protein
VIRPKNDRLPVVAAFGLAALIVLSGFTALSYRNATHWIRHTLEVRQAVNEWTIALLDEEIDARDYVLSDPAALPYRAALAVERAKAANLARLVADNSTQLRNVAKADRDARAATEMFHRMVSVADAGHRNEALALLAAGDSQSRVAAFSEDVDRIDDEEERLLDERSSRSNVLALVTVAGGVLLAFTSVAFLASWWSLQRRRIELSDRLTREARRHLETLSEIASALAEVRSRAQVASVVVDQGMRAARADTCTLYMLDERGLVLELIGERGVAAEIVAKIRRITETTGSPETFATLRSGNAMWAESDDDYAAIFPRLAATEAQGPRARAFWSVPLVVEGRPVGLLGMGFYCARRFSPEERTFIETFTKQCAQALVRAAHREREDEAQVRFATTLHSIGDAVIATDPQGRLTFMNAVAERLTGWTDGEAKGRKLDEVFRIFAEPTGEIVESPVAKVLREGMVVGLANHTVLRPKHGPQIPIHDSAAPIRDADGRLFGVVLVFRDASAEKREEAKAEFLARAGEALVSSLDFKATLGTVAHLAVPQLADWCAVAIKEPGAAASQQVAVAHVDPAKVQLARELGERYPPDPDAPTGVPEVIRTGKSELYTEIPAALLEASARDAEHLRCIRDLGLESAMVVPLRGQRSTLGAMTFVYAESGRRYSSSDLAFAEDFARRAALAIENALTMKQVEDARTREQMLRRDAEVANRAKDEFLATVSHELRTPLNAILGWTSTLRSRKLDADLDRPLAIVERNARAQAKLIEDVLDVSRIISGKLALNLGPTNLAEAIEASVETVTPAADAKDIAVSFDVDDGSLTITADAQRLQQVVWNLLTNAVKFTPKGGKVTVRGYREGSDVCICVTDTGEGIRPEVLPAVFEPFHQADSSTTRRHGGLGLGLAIVKHLVTAHGGTIRASSDGVGMGATFVVRLPARSVVPAVRTFIGPAKERLRLPRLDGLRLLVIDDEEDARLLVGAVLTDQGAEVHFSASATDALEKLSVLRPDVIVSDIGMPAMDGYSLIRKIRALSPALGGRTPAVALTAYARSEDAQLAFAAGFQMHVAKPIEPAQLAVVVANLGGRTQDAPVR